MDGLYFRVSSERQTIENQFEDLLEVVEKWRLRARLEPDQGSALQMREEHQPGANR